MYGISRRQLILSALSWAATTKLAIAQSVQGGAIGSTLPRPSDVIFSTRAAHPNSIDALKSFGATRCEWVYSLDATFVAALKAVVPHVGLSMNSNSSSKAAGAAAMDISGAPLIAPWLRGTEFTWSSSARQQERDSLTQQAQKAMSLGADSLQFDDPNIEYGAYLFAGGDFSPEAIQGFAKFAPNDKYLTGSDRASLEKSNWNIATWITGLQVNPDRDWASFKRQQGNRPVWLSWGRYLRLSVGAFLGSIRQTLHSGSPGISFSANVPNPLPLEDRLFMIENIDYLMSEVTSQDGPHQLAAYCLTAEAMEVPLVPSLAPKTVPGTRWQIALAYSLGATPIVPWDVYVPPGVFGLQSARYFGKTEDYGDLYQLVRKNPDLFDRWNLVSQVAIVVSPTGTNENAITQLVSKCLSVGIAPKFIVVGQEDDNTTYGLKQFFPAPAIAIPLGIADADAQRIFPSAAVMSPEKLISGVSGGTINVFQIQPPSGYLGFARENGGQELLLHVVNVSSRSETNPVYADIRLPSGSRFSALRTANIVTAAGTAIGTVSQVSYGPKGNIALRVSLPEKLDWAIVRLSA